MIFSKKLKKHWKSNFVYTCLHIRNDTTPPCKRWAFCVQHSLVYYVLFFVSRCMNRRYVWGVFLYSLLYVLIVIGVTVLVPNIGGEYVLRLSRQLSSFSIFTILFVIQEVILLVLLRGVFLRIQRSRKKGRRSLWTYFQDKWVRRGWKAFRKYVVGVFFVYLGITA